MAGTTQKSLLMAKFGDRFLKAADAHADDPVDLGGFGELPAGINGGIAKLDVIRIQPIADGKTNAGEPLFYAAGTVKSPKEFKGARIAGLRTSFTVNLFDKVAGDGGFDKGIAKVQAHLKALGATADQVRGVNLEATIVRFNEAAKSLVKPIHFRFRTWKGSKEVLRQGTDGKWRVYDEFDDGNAKPSKRKTGSWSSEEAAQKANPYAGRDPMVNHQWGERCDYSESDDGVRDGSAGHAPSVNGTASSAGSADAFSEYDPAPTDEEVAEDAVTDEAGEVGEVDADAGGDADAGNASEIGEGDGGASGEEDSEGGTESTAVDWATSEDIDALATAAGNEDASAFNRLIELATEAGVEDEVRNAPSWEESAQILTAAREAMAAPDEEPEPDPEPTPPPPPKKPKTQPAPAKDAAVWVPKVKWVYKYHRRDAKGNPVMDARTRKAAKPIEVMTLTVDPKAGTCTLQEVATKKTITAADGKTPTKVKFTDLIRE